LLPCSGFGPQFGWVTVEPAFFVASQSPTPFGHMFGIWLNSVSKLSAYGTPHAAVA